MSFDLANWLARLEALDPSHIEMGLERTATVLDNLQLAASEITIFIAGTNGKGSVAHFLDRAFRAQGRRVGRYTSPHLWQFNERICVDDLPADDLALVRAFDKVDAARGGVSLTYFEFTTLAALVVFAEANCDVRVLEVGLGGRLDAVNVLEPDAVVLTNVGLDHQSWLGDDVETIGREKAAVFRPKKPAIIGTRSPPQSVRQIAKDVLADVRYLGDDFDHQGNDHWHWQGVERAIERLPAMTGEHQRDNISAALALLESLDALPLNDALVRDWIAKGSPPGRLEYLHTAGFDWVLDVAHNLDSVAALAKSLAQASKPTTMVFGLMNDKPIEDMLIILAPQIDRWIAVQAPLPRALSASDVAGCIASVTRQPALIAGSPVAGKRLAERLTPASARIVVAGSFPVVGAIRAKL